MEDVLKSDIFFFVTTISVAVVTALISIFLIYAIYLLRKIRNEIEKMKTKSIFIKNIIEIIWEKIITR